MLCLIIATVDSEASASIQGADGNICVNCSDMDAGESKGCVVVVHSTQILESVMNYEIPKSNEMCFPQKDGEYTVAVFRQSVSLALYPAPVIVSVVHVDNPTPTTCKSGEVICALNFSSMCYALVPTVCRELVIILVLPDRVRMHEAMHWKPMWRLTDVLMKVNQQTHTMYQGYTVLVL